MPRSVKSVSLACHAECADAAIRCIDARVTRAAGALEIAYVARGEIARVRVPPRGAQRRADRLWEHTCFEAFVRRGEAHGYHELNFSPSGAWAAYAFERYRAGAASAGPALEPQVSVTLTDDALELHASVRLERLSGLYDAGRLELAVAAVVEDAHGALTYWALRHPAGRPDFHHPDSYALEFDD